jgi:hypothetical protein
MRTKGVLEFTAFKEVYKITSAAIGAKLMQADHMDTLAQCSSTYGTHQPKIYGGPAPCH